MLLLKEPESNIELNIFEELKMAGKKKQNLLIGVFNNLTFDQLRVFVRSANAHCDDDTHKVMISVDNPQEINHQLIQEGWSVVPLNINNREQIHMARFKFVHEYLKRYGDRYDLVISCDVRDIVFQGDPFEQMRYLIQECYQDNRQVCHHIVNQENILVKDEEWNKENILRCFGEYYYDKVKTCNVMNVGILAGTSGYISELCLLIHTLAQNRNDWVSDQAAYNVIGSMTMFNCGVHYTQPWDAFSVNLHIERHPDSVKKLKGKYEEDLAVDVINQQGVLEVCHEVDNDYFEAYRIVHQYDRDEKLLKYFTEMYK